MRGPIEDDWSADEPAAARDGRRREPPQDGADAQHELFRRKRLGEVVVGAE